MLDLGIHHTDPCGEDRGKHSPVLAVYLQDVTHFMPGVKGYVTMRFVVRAQHNA